MKSIHHSFFFSDFHSIERCIFLHLNFEKIYSIQLKLNAINLQLNWKCNYIAFEYFVSIFTTKSLIQTNFLTWKKLWWIIADVFKNSQWLMNWRKRRMHLMEWQQIYNDDSYFVFLWGSRLSCFFWSYFRKSFWWRLIFSFVSKHFL